MHATVLLLLVAGAAPAGKSATASLSAIEDAILAEPAPAARPSARSAWDGTSTPKYFQQLQGRWALSEEEQGLLRRNGFVVSPRFRQLGWPDALHEIHRSQQPLFVSSDAVFHTVFRSHEEFVSGVEREVLAPRLVRIVRAMQGALPAARALWPREVGEDVELYLRMARLLAVDEGITARAEEAGWLALIRGARGVQTVRLFGRERRIDFSRFQPRGHYVTHGLRTTSGSTPGSPTWS
ncbi:MAG: DUF3160 domain-containing protein [Myxococcales bacterium]